jgi:hypothetical protein
VRIAVLSVLACVALLAAQPAVAQDRGQSPSAAELRDSYPLDPGPQPAGDRSPAAPSVAPKRTVLQVAIFAMLAILAFAVGLAISVRRPGRQRKREPQDAVAPRAAQERSRGRRALPPVTRQAWTAEVQWQQTEAGSFFCAVARSAAGAGAAVVARSETVEWPPDSPATVQRLTAAARELETSLVAAGWRPLPPGDAWYAKRFAWQPVASTPNAKRRPSIEDRPGPRASRRFERRHAWLERVPAQGDRSTP